MERVADLSEQFYLCSRLRWCRFLLCDHGRHQSVDVADNDKDGKGNDEEINDVIDEKTVVDSRNAGSLGGGNAGRLLARKIDE